MIHLIDSQDAPPALKDMFIKSMDSLHGSQIGNTVEPGWNDRPPLLTPTGPIRGRLLNQEETLGLLKGMLRRGVPPVLRCGVWLSNVITSVHPQDGPEVWHEYRTLSKVRALDRAYDGLLRRIVGAGNDIHDPSVWEDLSPPVYGRKEFPEFCFVDGQPILAWKKVLIALEQVMGAVDYSPFLPVLCYLLLTHMSESYTFCALREMSHDSKNYFPTYKREFVAWCHAFCDIMDILHPGTADFLSKHMIFTTEGLAPIFRDLFSQVLQRKHVIRILDVFTLEGAKVIFRFGVALMVLFRMDQPDVVPLMGKEVESYWEAMRIWAHNERFNFDFLVKKAYGVHGRGVRRLKRFPRRTIMARIIKMEEEQLASNPKFDTSDSTPSRPLGLEKLAIKHRDYDDPDVPSDAKAVLGCPMQTRLRLAQWLPLSLSYCNLQLLYSTNYHGRSLSMFYERVGRFKHTVLLAEVFAERTQNENSTTPPKNHVIGFYASQEWRQSTRVYGDGECFLFRMDPDPKCWKWHPHGSIDVRNFEEEEEQTVNEVALLEQFQVSTRTYISMGGNRDGSSGLRFNEDFTKAESSPAEGFDNEPLSGHAEGKSSDMDIGLVEVYALTRPL